MGAQFIRFFSLLAKLLVAILQQKVPRLFADRFLGKSGMWRNISLACGGAAIALLLSGLVVLVVAMSVRYGLIESEVYLGTCAGLAQDDSTRMCGVRSLIVQLFLHQRLGWLSLACGFAAVILRRRALAWLGWGSGLAGLVLYNFDLAAVGGLLSLLMLARAPAQGGRCEA